MKTYTVSELNILINKTMSREYVYRNIAVQGTVTNLKAHFSGTLYFSLTDTNARIDCVVSRMKSPVIRKTLEEGRLVIVMGNVRFDTSYGRISLWAERVIDVEKSKAQAQREALRKELAAKGYFDVSHKKKLPLCPFHIGIITSRSGAVFHDIIKTGHARNRTVQYFLFSVPVQGKEAAAAMADAVRRANRDCPGLDLLIIARGGGSKDDLEPFNQPVLLDAVYESELPVISAVGHETDITLLDLTADCRASTPTQAAEIAIPEEDRILAYIRECTGRMALAAGRSIEQKQSDAVQCMKRMKSVLLQEKAEGLRLRVRMETAHMQMAAYQAIQKKKEDLQRYVGVLDRRNPAAFLQRGLMEVSRCGIPVRHVADLSAGDAVFLNDGSHTAEAEIKRVL